MRLLLAISLGKVIFFLTRVFKIGGGSAAPGYYALKIDPEVVTKLSTKIPTNVIITGTNGKTTTARMLNHLVISQKVKTIRNSTGSNLERGVASALIARANFFGGMNDLDVGIWEVDEAAFNALLPKIKPQIIVFLNIFRDQLDRYGEIDTILKRWWESLDEVDFMPTVITNFNDPKVSYFANHGKVLGQRFILQDHVLDHEANIDVKMKSVEYDFVANLVKNNGLSGTEIKVSIKGQKPLNIKLPIPGIYHVYDFLAAFAVYYNLNLSLDGVSQMIEDFKPAFGRVEEIKLGEKRGFIFLIKNPAGANSVFETINPELKSGDCLFLALNDNFADGTDVSWIWDANFEFLLGDRSFREEVETHFDYKTPKRKKPLNLSLKNNKILKLEVIVSGRRALDLALRLKYAGFKNIEVIPDLEIAFRSCGAKKEGRIFILPTYTAMLSLQKILAKKGIKKAYWKDN